MRNPVAKFLVKFNRSKVESNKKQEEKRKKFKYKGEEE